MTRTDPVREHLIETYRRKAAHYDLTSRLSPTPGYPQRSQRLRAVRSLGLRPGDTVVDVACGTGANFAPIERAIGPGGRLIGVDLTDAMLDRARARVAEHGWRNVQLVEADAAQFRFPESVDAILSTYALTQVPDCGAVIAHGAAALTGGGRWAVLDLKLPDRTPRRLARLGVAVLGSSTSLDEWMRRRPWETIRTAVAHELTDPWWTELCFGTAFLAVGSARQSGR